MVFDKHNPRRPVTLTERVFQETAAIVKDAKEWRTYGAKHPIFAAFQVLTVVCVLAYIGLQIAVILAWVGHRLF